MLEVGLRVVRGPDWKWDDQDGGEGHAGTVVEIGKPPFTGNSASSPNPADRTPDKTVIVQWDHGSRSNYRIGYQGAYDLLVFDNASAGIKHSNIICDGCKRHGISGIRWKCSQCFDYDLCTQCYMGDVHDLTHTFKRFQTANAVGVQLTPREGCTKMPLKGIFIGAKVIRGPDWEWGNQDGGRGKTGRVMDIRGWDNESCRSVATVTWSTGSTNVYRLGYKGCVDLCYVEEAKSGTYYREHLPLLGQPVMTIPDNGNNSTTAKNGGVTNATSSPHHLTFNVGDRVKVLLEVEMLKEMQDSGHGGWNPRMAECIGKIGTVHRITDKGDIRVQYEGCNNRWTFHPGALTKVTSKDAFVVGDVVRVKSDLTAIKHYQRGHGEWIDVMKNALGKTGKVMKIYADGDLRVALDSHTWTFNPLSVVLVPAGTNVAAATHYDANIIRDRSADGTDSEVEKLLRDAARGEAGVAAVREFLKKYPGRVDARAPGGGKKTCLQVAAHQGQRDLCNLLLDVGASLRAVDEDGDTPLHYAAFGNQPEVMELLLSRGATINAVNNGRCSALHVAVNKQHAQCVKMLLRYHCDINLQDSYGDTALHDAIGKDALDIIDALCACERVDFKLRNKRGFNVLHHAALKGNAHATEKLVARARNLVDVKKDDGFAALHLAALNGHREVAAILLSQNGGRATVDLRNNRQQTPLHLATSQGHWSLVELLVHHNANIACADEDGDTVLHIAIAKSPNQQTIVPTTESSRDSPLIYAIWQALARQGAKTELALACFLVSIDVSCTLLETAKNHKEKTPLDLLEADPQASQLADLLRSYRYQNHNTQLEIENNPPTGYIEPSTYRIDNMSPSEGLRDARKSIPGAGDDAECRDCSGIVSGTKQENRFDSDSALVGCAHCGHTIVKKQTIQDGQLAAGEVSIANPEDNSPEGKRKEEISEKEKDKDLERLRYLETRVADLEEANMCSICMERRRNVAFLCGHGACEHCAAPLKTCHMCRKTITKKINLY
ncbi:E3 ubiquitin-protein ligase MIB2 isoform X2 [Harpegnathos saltator]|uniref:RING-type E3 ubiquitin transferase n=1 Tax=Harpegnathos saltator TaxID=610380 RepID=E2BU06_HARSA|nr:E3 ubiquitin-protein ligase MIB2 isoform X2 [Harpegnathos saltator]EFN80905.1 E3 ubiquitin-protein ligase MIB2 [Harpegnathos saltator]